MNDQPTNDLIHRLLKGISHNRYLVLGLLLAASAVTCFAMARPKTPSPLTGEPVDATTFQQQAARERARLEARRDALNREIEAYNESVELGLEDLARQQATRREIVQVLGGALTTAAQGGLTAADLVVPGLSVLGLALGVGAGLDNRRKDRLIAEAKASSK